MGAFYRHTQTGAALRWGLILPAIGLLAIGFAARRAVPFAPLGGASRRDGLGVLIADGRGHADAADLVLRPGPVAQKHRARGDHGRDARAQPLVVWLGHPSVRRAAGSIMSAGSMRSNSP